MRAPHSHARLWVRSSWLRQAGYLETIRDCGSALGERFFEEIDKRRSSTASLRLVLFAIHVVVFSFLALSLIPTEANSSVPAIPFVQNSLREILVVVSAILALGVGFIGYHHDVLAEILAAYAEHRGRENRDIQELLRISYGIAVFPVPPANQGRIRLGGGYRLFIRILAALAVLIFAAAALGSIFIRLKVLEAIYFAPSFSTTVSVCVIVFVLMCDLVGFLLFLANVGPIYVREIEEGERTSPRSNLG